MNNKKNIDRLLNTMLYGLSGNKVGVPVSAIIIKPGTFEPLTNESGEIIKFHNIKLKNSCSKNRSDNCHHAEHLCLKMLDNIEVSNLIMVTTIPPCKKCLAEIKDSQKISKVYFLINEGQESKDYIYHKKYTGPNIVVEYLNISYADFPQILKIKKKFFAYKRFVYNNKKWQRIWDNFN